MKKQTPTIVYKIFRAGLLSWSPPRGCEQQYYTDRINRPKIPGSYIFAFETLTDAQQFDAGAAKVIYKCEATGVNRRRKKRMSISACIDLVRAFWRGEQRDRTSDLNDGVVLVKTLRLIERVPNTQD